MRPTTAARLLLGAVGLLIPRSVVPLWGADPRSERVVVVARVLGARHLAQGALLAAHPTRRADIVSAAVDLLHGLTMVALAAASPRFRRPAATSACVAVTFASLTGVRLKRSAPTSPAATRTIRGRVLGAQRKCLLQPSAGELMPDRIATQH